MHWEKLSIFNNNSHRNEANARGLQEMIPNLLHDHLQHPVHLQRLI